MNALLRLTGWAAVAAATVHLLQFLVLGIGPVLGEPEFPTPAQSAAGYWFGAAGAVTFTLIGLAYLAFFSGATELAWRDARGTSVVWRRAAQSAAVIGIACWLLAGMNNLARRGVNATAIAQAADDDVVARAALASTYVFQTAAVIAGAVALCAWWVAFALRARRARVFGWPTATAIAILGGVVPVAGWVVNLGGVPTTIIAFAILGPVLLSRARRAPRDAPVPGDSALAQ